LTGNRRRVQPFDKGMPMSLLIGLLAGGFGGLVGLGGGVLMIPLMVGFKNITQHKAHGTSLVALVFTAISGAFIYALHNAVDVQSAVLLAAAALLPARWGAKYCADVPEMKLKRIFGVFLIIVSIFMLLKPYLPLLASLDSGGGRLFVLLVTGMVTGFFSGLMGVGGGPIMISGMVLLAGFDQHIAQGTSLLAMAPVGAVGAFTHWQLGNIEKDILPGLILGIIVGTFAGGTFAHLLPEAVLRMIFTVVLVWTGLRFIKPLDRRGTLE
jgi:uncharacterized membrane protein YfcA